MVSPDIPQISPPDIPPDIPRYPIIDEKAKENGQKSPRLDTV